MEEIKDYLIIYGINTCRNLPCFCEKIIDYNELDKFKDIIKLVKEKENGDNWVWTIYLELDENGKYQEHHFIYDMYPTISHEILDAFGDMLPGGITKIESIKIYKGQKIKII